MARLLTTAEAAAELGVKRSAVQKMIARGRLRAVRMGRDLFVPAAAVEAARSRPGRGRPRKKNETVHFSLISRR